MYAHFDDLLAQNEKKKKNNEKKKVKKDKKSEAVTTTKRAVSKESATEQYADVAKAVRGRILRKLPCSLSFCFLSKIVIHICDDS